MHGKITENRTPKKGCRYRRMRGSWTGDSASSSIIRHGNNVEPISARGTNHYVPPARSLNQRERPQCPAQCTRAHSIPKTRRYNRIYGVTVRKKRFEFPTLNYTQNYLSYKFVNFTLIAPFRLNHSSSTWTRYKGKIR